MRKGYSLGLFLVLDLVILLTSHVFLSLLDGKHQLLKGSAGTSVEATFAAIPDSPAVSEAEIIPADARSTLVNNFLVHYKSPMAGLGETVVTLADEHGLPFWIVPAIAQCESNLGKRIPEESYNAWGWGIYGEKVTKFRSWEEGVKKVTEGLSKNYLGTGLTTPEEIMSKYTPSSNGSWAFCVREFLKELM